jgi:signal transduction histidine kinase/ActR/RegA family two-component response regulator
MQKHKLAFIAVIIVIAGLLFVAERKVETVLVQNAKRGMSHQVLMAADDLGTTLQQRVTKNTYALLGLRALIQAHPDISQKEFAEFARVIKQFSPAIRNIAAAPGLVIKYIYPLEGNEKALGLDYRKAPPEQRAAVFRSAREGRLVIAGPVTLVQGGVAVILRLPVYVPNYLGKKELWGVLAAPVDLSVILKDSGLAKLQEQYHIAIRGKDGKGSEGDVFFGDGKLFVDSADSVIRPVQLLNGSWVIALKPKAGWPTTTENVIWVRAAFILAFAVSVILGWFIAAYTREKLMARDRRSMILREKTEFLEILSHEIRSPLQGVLAAQKYLLDNGLQGQMREVVTTAHQTGNYIVGLINDYLDLQRAETDNLTVIRDATDVRGLINDVLDITSGSNQDQMTAVNYNVADNVPFYLSLDERKVRQILVNIVGNSVKYTDQGFIRISAKFEEISGSPHIIFVIEDTGIGIEPEELATLFDRFTRSEGGESKAGSGLGLAIASKLVAVMDGDISVDSKFGEGTTFRVSIPTSRVEEDLNAFSHDEENYAPFGRENLKNTKILVADDVTVNRILLSAMLTPLTLKTTLAEDGVQVLQALKEDDYDVIIMDARMPNMSGLEATLKIRENPNTNLIPIIGLTGEDSEVSIEALKKAGMNSVLRKPIALDPLLDEICDVLGKSTNHEQMAI